MTKVMTHVEKICSDAIDPFDPRQALGVTFSSPEVGSDNYLISKNFSTKYLTFYFRPQAKFPTSASANTCLIASTVATM